MGHGCSWRMIIMRDKAKRVGRMSGDAGEFPESEDIHR